MRWSERARSRTEARGPSEDSQPQRPPALRWLDLWKRINTCAGYLVFGLSAAASLAAFFATVTHFGLWPALGSAGAPALLTSAPLGVWILYTRFRPRTFVDAARWVLLGGVASALLWFSPLFFGAVPIVGLMVSESAHALTASRRSDRRDVPVKSSR